MLSGMQRVNLDTNILIAAIRNSLTDEEHRILAGAEWAVCPIVFWEIAMLAQKGRLEIDLESPPVVQLFLKLISLPLTLEVARVSTQLDFSANWFDELIAATSVVYGIPLMTRDATIRGSEMVPLAC